MLASGAALFLLFFTLFAVISGGRSAVIAVLVGYALSTAALVWRRARRGPGKSGLRSFATFVFVVTGVGALAALAGNLVAMRRPAQATLAARFAAHRAEYEQLRDLLIADRLMAAPECGESSARYETLLRALDCPSVAVKPDGTVSFSLASWGAANRGWRIALVWSKQKPSPLLPTLDGFQKAKGRSQWETAFSQLQDDWYLTIVW